MLIATNEQMFDATGKYIGYKVIEVQEAYTFKEATERSRKIGCPECGAVGEHRAYFVKTGQGQGGDVSGIWKRCTRENT